MEMKDRKPQGGVHAYLTDCGATTGLRGGRVWVERINTAKGVAYVRFDAGESMRSREYVVNLSNVDFTREWKF